MIKKPSQLCIQKATSKELPKNLPRNSKQNPQKKIKNLKSPFISVIPRKLKIPISKNCKSSGENLIFAKDYKREESGLGPGRWKFGKGLFRIHG